MKNRKKIRLFILVIIVCTCFLYSRYISINRFCKNENIIEVGLVLSDVKAGLSPVETTKIETVDQQEIQEIVNILNKSKLLKTLPSLGNVKCNTNDRFELRIFLITETKRILEYLITSEGHIQIKRNNDKSFSNAIILNGSAIECFNDLKRLFDQKSKIWRDNIVWWRI